DCSLSSMRASTCARNEAPTSACPSAAWSARWDSRCPASSASARRRRAPPGGRARRLLPRPRAAKGDVPRRAERRAEAEHEERRSREPARHHEAAGRAPLPCLGQPPGREVTAQPTQRRELVPARRALLEAGVHALARRDVGLAVENVELVALKRLVTDLFALHRRPSPCL